MELLKVLEPHRKKAMMSGGYLTISEGVIFVKIQARNMIVKDIGIIKDGIGVLLKEGNERKLIYATARRVYNGDYIPANLQSEGYTFRIPATKISDTEYAFMFADAKTSKGTVK